MGFVARIFSPPKPSAPPPPPPAPAPAPVLQPSGSVGGDAAKDIVRKRKTRTILTSPQGLELGTGAGKSLLGQ